MDRITPFKAFAFTFLIGLLCQFVSAETLTITGRPGLPYVDLVGPDARQQLVVMSPEGRDITREVTFITQPANIISIDGNGLITPQANGSVQVIAQKKPPTEGEAGKTATAQITIKVSSFETPQPISFPNDVVPILTRNHCNAGACHAKAAGQNGFSLSLFGYEPKTDFETLVKNARGRRVSPTAPENSLLVMKASGNLPHGGGARLDPASEDYRFLVRWIAEGVPYGPEKDPLVEKISIFPGDALVKPGAKQQLTVTAFFDNGTTRDITRSAQFEPNQEDMAEVDGNGLVSMHGKPGSASIMVRFQEHVDVFQATIPVGNEKPNLPPPANFIDEGIFNKLSLLGLPPSAPGTDATFIRRATIDIAGRIPSTEETKAFFADTSPDKRAKLIDRLVDSNEYADYFAGKWAGLLRNKSSRGLEWVSRDTYGFHNWIRKSLIENKPFDQFASELITASGKTGENPAVGWYRAVTDPKERMQDIAQVFLGIRMQCAQCHHHPYERWSQDDYYGFVAFFSTIARKEVYRLPEDDIVYHNRKVAETLNPGTKVKMKPTPPGGKTIDIPAEQDPRHELAKWVRSKENPYFARMVVNRYWKHFFGTGLTEPEDDIRPTNPASHPALLNDLAEHFKASGFDLKELVRVICNSKTYQFSSDPVKGNAEDTQNYARFHPRRMQAEVLLDAVNDLTGADNSFNKQPLGVRAISLPDDNSNSESEFLTMFGRPRMDSACECERTPEANLGQSLHLINADLIQQKLSTSGGTAALLASQADRSDEERLSDLYLKALCRAPDADELSIAKSHLKKKRQLSAEDPEKLKPQVAEQQAFEDLIWVLVNTKEFLFNH